MIFKKYIRFISTAIFCYLVLGTLSSVSAYDFSTGIFEFQQKLAKKGDAQAQYKLAYMFEHGQGTEKNINSAIGWYKKAAKKRYPAATMRLTYIDTQKNGYNAEKHSPWLAKLKQDAGDNDGESLFLLATMHKDGFIVKKDLKRSSRLFKRAMKKDVPGAEAAYEAVQVTLSGQKSRTDTRRANAERADAEKTRTDKARADKTRAEKEKALQQQAADKHRAEQQRQQKLAAQRAKRDHARAERVKAEQERADRKRREEAARKAEKQRITQEKIAAEEARKAKEEEKPLVDKNMCKGKKAKFLTTCR